LASSLCDMLIWGLILLICSFVGGMEDDFDNDDHEIGGMQGMSTLTLEHTFDSGPNPVFTKRGTITIRSLKTGSAFCAHDAPVTDRDIDKLQTLVENDDFYRVRIVSKSTANNGDPTHHVMSFIKACLLYESGLSDLLTLNVDQSGVVLGVSMTTHVPYCEGYAVSERSLNSFNTTVDVIQTATGPMPETQVYVQRMEHEKAAKEKGGEVDNRSFFAKYWMYLIPLFIFLMFASSNQGGDAAAAGR
jgi:hypothetical protein